MTIIFKTYYKLGEPENSSLLPPLIRAWSLITILSIFTTKVDLFNLESKNQT